MPNFDRSLDEALNSTPQTIQEHCGFCDAGILKPLKSGLSRSSQRFTTTNTGKPPPVHNNLKRVRVNLSDDSIKEEDLSALIPDAPAAPEAAAPTPAAPAPTPVASTTGYTLEQAKGQLDGITKQWMQMAGKYPAGSVAQDKFLEIGKRLVEISGTIDRDFIQGSALKEPGATSSPVGEPPVDEKSELDLGLEPEAGPEAGPEAEAGSKEPEEELELGA